MKSIVVSICLMICFFGFLPWSEAGKTKIAIVGAGIGGATCALYLKELLKENIEIDIYESGKVGGRLAHFDHDGSLFETGGTIINKSDKYITNIVETHELKKKKKVPLINAHFVNNKLTIQTPFGIFKTILSNISAIAEAENKSKNKKFGTEIIYEKQREKQTFETVNEMIIAMNEKHLITTSMRELVHFHNLNTKFLYLLEGYTRFFYGQSAGVPSFVALSALHRLKGSYYSVNIGNLNLADLCIKSSKSQLLLEKVIGINQLKNGTFEIMTNEKNKRNYDIVVIATPLAENLNKIKFAGNKWPKIPTGTIFMEKVITFIIGKLKKNHFKTSKTPHGISFLDNNDIDCILKVGSTKNNYLWKIQSSVPLFKQGKLDTYFENIFLLKEIRWNAYPNYSSRTLRDDDRFVLANNLLYINCIEWAASSMEMSAIAAKNVALLIYKSFRKNIKRKTGISNERKYSRCIRSAYILPFVLCLPTFYMFGIKEYNIKEDANITATAYEVNLTDYAEKNDELYFVFYLWTYAVIIKLIPCIILSIITIWLIRRLKLVSERQQRLGKKRHSITLTTIIPTVVSTTNFDMGCEEILLSVPEFSNNGNRNKNINNTNINNIDNSSICDNNNFSNDDNISEYNNSYASFTTNNNNNMHINNDHQDLQFSYSSSHLKRIKIHRSTRILIAVLILFIITELPQAILGLMSGIYGRKFFTTCYILLGDIMDLLALFNGAVNFILYCWMSKQFRDTFRTLFKPTILLSNLIQQTEEIELVTTNV